jgi:diaminobutyrate-2-oxoglutarate transaminase
LICDDIQVGCGRTGPFFSFERAGVVPDLVTLSKSISGYGGPMSLLLMKPQLDVWEPGEHNGTFRGHQLSFIGAKAALDFWRTREFERDIAAREAFLKDFLETRIMPVREGIVVRGLGMIWGIDLTNAGGSAFAEKVTSRCFENGLIVERVGRNDTVIKILPPLNIGMGLLEKGCAIIRDAILKAR